MLINQIKILELLSDRQKFEYIQKELYTGKIPYEIHRYQTGKNILLHSGKRRRIGIGSHFDTVYNHYGANDNASAVVVCLELARRLKHNPTQKIGVDIFFFDEEEKGLIGSTAYCRKLGINGFLGFLNMELVGMGNQFAIWPVQNYTKGTVLDAFERSAKDRGIPTSRFDRIIMNTADHQSFREYGLQDSFTITCIGEKDIEVATHYYKAMEFDVNQQTLYEIINQAPIFEHYHQLSDRSVHLSEETLQMTVEAIWRMVIEIDTAF